MIRTVMDKGDWLILLTLAAIWGGAFLFIGVAVRHVHPLTYVWLRLTIAAAATLLIALSIVFMAFVAWLTRRSRHLARGV